MQHLGTVTLETDRLLLRRFTKNDIPIAYRNWMSDEKITTYLRRRAHASGAVTASVIDDWIVAYERDAFYLWAIERKSLGEPIGSISVVEQDASIDMVHIGYCIGSRRWRQGIASERCRRSFASFSRRLGQTALNPNTIPKIRTRAG